MPEASIAAFHVQQESYCSVATWYLSIQLHRSGTINENCFKK